MVPFSGDMLIFGDVISGIPPSRQTFELSLFSGEKIRVQGGMSFSSCTKWFGGMYFPPRHQRSRCFLDPSFSKEGNLEPPLALLQSPVLRPAATWVFGRIDVGSLWVEG